MNKMKTILISLLLLLTPFAARAQSLTTGCSSPPPSYGVVWTAGQWITCLSSLQAALGYTPLNIAGGAMSGELFTAPSLTSSAPFNMPPGVAPTSPANGDMWFQSTGLFYRAGGVSIGPLASTTSPSFSNPTFTGTATFPDGTTWTSAVITPGTAPWASITVTGTATLGGASAAESLRVVNTASAVNRVTVAGGTTGNGPTVTSAGSNTNVDLNLLTQGTGGFNFLTNTTAKQLVISHTASATRWVTITGSNGGTQSVNTSAGPLALGAAGSAALNLTAGGTNQVTVVGGTVPAINTSAGNLTIGSTGATTILSDAAVQLSNAGYHTCSLIGTDSSGTFTCGGAPSGYITYNDNRTTSVSPAVTGNLYCMNTAAGALSITLPAAPANGDYIAFSDCGGNFGTNALTISNGGNNIMYNSGAMTVNTNYAGGVLRYSLGKTSWILSPL